MDLSWRVSLPFSVPTPKLIDMYSEVTISGALSTHIPCTRNNDGTPATFTWHIGEDSHFPEDYNWIFLGRIFLQMHFGIPLGDTIIALEVTTRTWTEGYELLANLIINIYFREAGNIPAYRVSFRQWEHG